MKNSKTFLKVLSTTLASTMLFNSSFAGAAESTEKAKKSLFGPGFLTGATVSSVIFALGAIAAYNHFDPQGKDKELSDPYYKKALIIMLAHEINEFAQDPLNNMIDDYKKLKDYIKLTPESKHKEEDKIHLVMYPLHEYYTASKKKGTESTMNIDFINCFGEESKDIRGFYVTKDNHTDFLKIFKNILQALCNKINAVPSKTAYENLLLACLKNDFKIEPQTAQK